MSTQRMSGGVTLREDYKRAASWWRAAGFPVPQDIPDNALGYIRGSMSCAEIHFEWNVQIPETEKS